MTPVTVLFFFFFNGIERSQVFQLLLLFVGLSSRADVNRSKESRGKFPSLNRLAERAGVVTGQSSEVKDLKKGSEVSPLAVCACPRGRWGGGFCLSTVTV